MCQALNWVHLHCLFDFKPLNPVHHSPLHVLTKGALEPLIISALKSCAWRIKSQTFDASLSLIPGSVFPTTVPVEGAVALGKNESMFQLRAMRQIEELFLQKIYPLSFFVTLLYEMIFLTTNGKLPLFMRIWLTNLCFLMKKLILFSLSPVGSLSTNNLPFMCQSETVFFE